MGVVEIVEKNGKRYVKILDYDALRGLFAELLAEIQRIKSEGDYNAARELVESYGVKVDKPLHDEILERYAELHIAPYKGFINPWMKPIFNAQHEIQDIELDYTESFTHQMLRYSTEYGIL